ncbi:hypothetical protein D3C78_856000 [compost metagenome]
MIQIGAINRLEQIIDHSGADGLSCIFKIIIAANHNGKKLRVIALDNLQQLHAVKLRHLHINHSQINFMLSQKLKTFPPVGRLQHLNNAQSLPVAQYPYSFAKRLLVIYYKYLIHGLLLLVVTASAFLCLSDHFE